MNLSLFYEGIKMGLIVAIPIGPITMICIQNSLSGNIVGNIAIGLALGTAYALYTILGALSLSSIIYLLDAYGTPIELFGIAMILAIAASTILGNSPKKNTVKKKKPNIATTYFSILALTLASLMTITLFATAFSGLETTYKLTKYSYLAVLTSGVLFASIGWFALLSGSLVFCRQWLPVKSTIWINSGAGIFMLLYALKKIYVILF
jgi:threonine/homoserine/homoserine lactone efflux protein